MPAARKKLVAVVEAAVDADPRAALTVAIEAEQKANDVVVAKLEALARARDGILAAEAHLEKSRAAIAKAKETDIRTASTNLDRGASPVVAWHLNSAVSDVERSEVALEIADGAHKRKRDEVAVVEDNRAEATNDKLTCIKQMTKADIVQQMDGLRQARRRVAILTRSIAEYLNDDPKLAPRFHDDMRGFRAIAAREAVFAGIKDEAARLLFGPSDADFEAGLEMAKAALVALGTDPQTKLPKV